MKTDQALRGLYPFAAAAAVGDWNVVIECDQDSSRWPTSGFAQKKYKYIIEHD